jgi:RNA polymerase sigma-70 factor (ECF subfamily)
MGAVRVPGARCRRRIPRSRSVDSSPRAMTESFVAGWPSIGLGAGSPTPSVVPVEATGREVPAVSEDDRAAVSACQGGDREAFDRLVERYQRDVYRLCFRYVNNHQDANDLAQEAFLKAFKAIGRFRGDSAFSTWLYRIAVNACLSFRSSRKPEGDEVPDALPDGRPGALDGVIESERSRKVREAVGRLPAKQRATVILKIYQDLSHEEVAKAMGSSVGTVKANLFHALANLRKLLPEVGE